MHIELHNRRLEVGPNYAVVAYVLEYGETLSIFQEHLGSLTIELAHGPSSL